MTSIEFIGYTKPNKYGQRHAIWYCICDCGGYVERTSDVILRDKSSCGCVQKEHLRDMSNKNIKHNASNKSIYNSYRSMMSRCHREKDIHYKEYGLRGVAVCDEWKNNPSNFIKWAMNNGYKEHLTIERIDNNEGYSPENCCWIPKEQQSKNKRQNIMITYFGLTLCCSDWGRLFGINDQTIRWRYKKGWDISKIFNYLPLPEPYKEDNNVKN